MSQILTSVVYCHRVGMAKGESLMKAIAPTPLPTFPHCASDKELQADTSLARVVTRGKRGCKEARGGLSGSKTGCSQFSSQVLDKKACKDNLITSASHLCSNDTVLE